MKCTRSHQAVCPVAWGKRTPERQLEWDRSSCLYAYSHRHMSHGDYVKVRWQLYGVSFHLCLGFRDWFQVTRLAKQVLLPTGSSSWPQGLKSLTKSSYKMVSKPRYKDEVHLYSIPTLDSSAPSSVGPPFPPVWGLWEAVNEPTLTMLRTEPAQHLWRTGCSDHWLGTFESRLLLSPQSWKHTLDY